MGASTQGQPGDVSHATPRVIHLDDAWSQPLGPLDLLELELHGAALEPAFSPTVVQYEAFPETDPVASGEALVVELAVAPARRSTPVSVASFTGRVEQLGRDRYRLHGLAGRDHHLTVTVGHPRGPSRTTVIVLRADGAAIR